MNLECGSRAAASGPGGMPKVDSATSARLAPAVFVIPSEATGGSELVERNVLFYVAPK
jgi:hypothetical protein